MSVVTIHAWDINEKEHMQAVKGYIEELRLVQNQLFTVAQKIVFEPEQNEDEVEGTILRIEDSLKGIQMNLAKEVEIYTDDRLKNRDLLLLTNALNYIESSVAELFTLMGQESFSEKMMTLERYFNFRVYGSNTLRLVENMLLSW